MSSTQLKINQFRQEEPGAEVGHPLEELIADIQATKEQLRLEDSIRHIQTEINKLIKEVSKNPNLQEVCTIIVSKIKRLLELETATIYLGNDDLGRLELFVRSNDSKRSTSIPYETDDPASLAYADAHPVEKMVSPSDSPIKQRSLALPVQFQNDPVAGVLDLFFPYGREDLHPDMINALEMVTIHLAPLLKVLHLQSLATVDEMTGLNNKREFNSQFVRCIEQIERGKIPSSSIFLLDADGLKSLNDNLDYETGNALLKGIALCMQDVFKRDIDAKFRIGGDEFAAISMVNSLEDQAQLIRQLKERFKSMQIEHIMKKTNATRIDNSPVMERVDVVIRIGENYFSLRHPHQNPSYSGEEYSRTVIASAGSISVSIGAKFLYTSNPEQKITDKQDRQSRLSEIFRHIAFLMKSDKAHTKTGQLPSIEVLQLNKAPIDISDPNTYRLDVLEESKLEEYGTLGA